MISSFKFIIRLIYTRVHLKSYKIIFKNPNSAHNYYIKSDKNVEYTGSEQYFARGAYSKNYKRYSNGLYMKLYTIYNGIK